MRLLYQVGGVWVHQVGGAWVQGYCTRWEGLGHEAVSGGRGLGMRLLYQGGGATQATVSGGRGLGMRLLYQVGGAWV